MRTGSEGAPCSTPISRKARSIKVQAANSKVESSSKLIILEETNNCVMAGTFSQIYLQFVFAVQGRQSLIPQQHRDELHKYITSLVQARNAKMLAVFCMPDHLHLFTGIRPAVVIPDFVKEVKVQSNQFINEKG